MQILIKGAGEMATGVAHRLFMAGFPKIVMTEIEKPLSVRRTVALAEAVYEGSFTVEGLTARLIRSVSDAPAVWKMNDVPLIVDPQWQTVADMKPDVVVDAIMAKRNTGTVKTEAEFVVGIGPGFRAPVDCHVVIESNRGHDLGRVLLEGEAEPHTGVPGDFKGFTVERVLRSPHPGRVRHVKDIGDEVRTGDVILYIDDTPVTASIDGMLRGLIRDIDVGSGEKVGDIDPRGRKEYCFTITDKARALGGGVLEAVMHHFNR